MKLTSEFIYICFYHMVTFILGIPTNELNTILIHIVKSNELKFQKKLIFCISRGCLFVDDKNI